MIQFFTTIKGGKPTNPVVWRKYLNSMPDGQYMVKFEGKSKRSALQNGYYWGCVIPLMQEGLIDAGWSELNSPSKVHEFLKDMFLKEETVNTKTGEIKTVPGSSKELSKSEFNAYIAQIQQHAAEYLNLYIPDPNQSADLWSDYAEPAKSQRV